MSAAVLPARLTAWLRWGGALGLVGGLAAGFYVDWYFTSGPGAAGRDAGEAHGFIAMIVGFPFSLAGMYAGRAGFVLSAAASWAVVGAVVAAIAGLAFGRIRESHASSRPPAG